MADSSPCDLDGGEIAPACVLGDLYWQIAHLGDLNGEELAAAGEEDEL